MNLSKNDIMESLRDRTYGRSGSQNLLDRTRHFSEDLRSVRRDQVESNMVQKDAADSSFSRLFQFTKFIHLGK